MIENPATLELSGTPDGTADTLAVREPGGQWVPLIDFAKGLGLTPEALRPAFGSTEPSGAPTGTLTFGDLGRFPWDIRSIAELSALLGRPLLVGAR